MYINASICVCKAVWKDLKSNLDRTLLVGFALQFCKHSIFYFAASEHIFYHITKKCKQKQNQTISNTNIIQEIFPENMTPACTC